MLYEDEEKRVLREIKESAKTGYAFFIHFEQTSVARKHGITPSNRPVCHLFKRSQVFAHNKSVGAVFVEIRQKNGCHSVSVPLVKQLGYVVVRADLQVDFLNAV